MPPKVKISKQKTRSSRAGLTFPVCKVHRFLKEGNYARRLSNDAAIYLTAAIEYLCTELLKIAVKTASDKNRRRVTPRVLLLAIRNNKEFDKLLQDVVISKGGVLPNIHPQLLL